MQTAPSNVHVHESFRLGGVADAADGADADAEAAAAMEPFFHLDEPKENFSK